MTQPPKIRSHVRLALLPPWVAALPEDSRRVFHFCLGKTYRVVDVGRDGLVVLDVSGDVDEKFGGFMNDIRVEPEFLERK